MAEDRREEVPTLPAPVEIPEYFPGFTQQFEALGAEFKVAYHKLQQAQKELDKPIMTHMLAGYLPDWMSRSSLYSWIMEPILTGKLTDEQISQLKAPAIAEFDTAAQVVQKIEWKWEMMQVMALYLSDPHYEINSAEDMLQYVNPGFDIGDEDIAWMNQLFEDMAHLSNTLPEEYRGDILETQAKLLEDILTKPKVEMKGVHHLTVEEIAKAFAYGVPELPPGLSESDVRALLARMNLSDEELKERREWLADRARDWEIESARMNLIRAGALFAEKPELTPAEWFKMIATQPMMATVELMQGWWDAISRPLSAAITMHLPAPVAGLAHGTPLGLVAGGIAGGMLKGLGIGAVGGPIGMAGGAIVGAIIGAVAGTVIFSIHADEWSQELEKHYRFYRDELGESAWSSYAQAFNEWDAPWWQKAILDSAYDPLFWIGWGGATAVGQKLKTIGYGAKGLKGAGARVGHLISSFEQGYCSGMDAIFKAGTQVVAAPIKSAFWLTGAGYTIPRTYTMMARNFARSSMMNFKAVAERLYPEARSLKGLTPKDVKDVAEFCIRAVNTSPMDGNNLAVRAGANLMEFGYLDDIAAGRMMKAMTGELLWDTPRLARFNNQLADFLSGQGERITAGRMLGELGVEATEQTVKELADKLIKFREATSQAAMKAITGDTADAMILSIFNRLESTRYANLHSPFTKYMQQAGRTSSWHSRVADKILYSAQLIALERKVVMPIARHQLLFSQFGPWAYGETMCRSFLGGAEVMHPSKYSGVEETNRLLKGLAGAPHELRMFEKGFKRMSQTVVDPKTGHTVVYKGGKIPFITRDVTIPDKVPILGGKKIGARVSIAGRDFHIGSFGDQYDFWAYFSSNQLAFDYQVHYMKALAELDPDNMGRIARIMSDNKHLLDDISSLSKADAQDIMRVLGQEATISPTDIRFHADIDVLEYQRRQISRDLNRVMDNLNDVRAMTKKSIESEVLDGSMFSKGTAGIDESIANKVAAEREMSLVGLEHQIKALQSEADMFIANPPKNLQEFMGDMQNITSHLEAVGETMHDFRRLTELRKAKLMPAEFDAFEVGSAKTLARYMDTAEESLAKIINQLSDNASALNRGSAIFWDEVLFDDDLIKLGLDKKIKEMVEQLPIEMQMQIDQIMIDPTKPGLAGFHEHLNAIYFKSAKEVTDVNLYHEIAHQYMANLYQKDWRRASDLLTEYFQVNPGAKNLKTNIGKLAESTSYDMSYEYNKALHESFSEHFQAWFRVPDLQAKWAQDFFGANFPRKMEKALDAVQLGRLNDLADISRLELQNILATRHKIADIEAVIPRTPKKARDARFWQQQRSQKALIWDEFDSSARRFKAMRLGASRNFLDSVGQPAYVPDYVPEVVDQLSPNHLAYLYGVTGDDLYRGLTRVQHQTTVRPKEDFIIFTRSQADAYAAKLGKTADQLGFTNEAIGDVYDQMWRSLGVDPTILSPDHPTLLQLEEIRQELHRLHAANKIPESDVVKWRQYINKVADDVGELGIYKIPVTAPVADVPEGYVRLYRAEGIRRKDLPSYLKDNEELASIQGRWFTEDLDTLDWYIKDAGGEANVRIFSVDVPVSEANKYKGVNEGFRQYSRNPEHEFFLPKDVAKQKVTATKPAAPTIPAAGGTPDWWATKEKAISKAREMHKLSYPTYDDANIIDESMRAIFPFWNYELFRWRWIPRTFMRTPGTLSGLARYMHYTDTGYTPIPGTDLQINPLRGTVWLGGLRSFWRRDFPEYHDAAPAMEFMHYIGRAGFFPGVHVMLPIVLFGDPERVGGVPQLGQLSPRWVKTSLSGLRALSPEHIGRVLEIVYPDRFRDYMSMVTLASWGHDGDEIWKKKKQNIKLTEEEEKLWLKAVNEVDGLKGVLMNQTGLFRIRPQEFGEIRREMHLAIEEATGVPVSVQEWIDKTYPVTGKRFTDYFHLDIQQQALLYQWETYRRYQGIMTPLYPSSWQALDIRISDYYQELSRVFEETRYHGRYDEDGKLLRPSMVDINRDLVEGNISPDSWRSQRSSMQQGLAEAAYILGQTPLYKDVPKTFEERAKLLEERGIVTPTQTPDQELLYYYYELKPDYKYDWEMDRMELDFDTYYAHIDALLESLSPQHRERLLERIQNDWTPMELLYWEFSREYARPYRNLREIVLRSYTPEQQQIIRRFEVARGDERTELQEVMGPDGKLISSFQRKLREARLSLRMMDPELDAWLNFFGTTDKLVTAKAKEVYADLRKQYLTDSMIGSAKQ